MIVLRLLLYISNNPSKTSYDISNTKDAWKLYDQSLNNIKNNMDSITIGNENFYWWELKDFDIEDKEYKQILNNLVADIRMYYLELTDDGTLYTNTNPIRKYRNKNTISKEELEKLVFDMTNESKTGRLHTFNNYSTLLISSDENNRNDVLDKTSKFNILNNTDFSKNVSYNELLNRKVIEVLLLEDLSEFIESEYYRLK